MLFVPAAGFHTKTVPLPFPFRQSCNLYGRVHFNFYSESKIGDRNSFPIRRRTGSYHILKMVNIPCHRLNLFFARAFKREARFCWHPKRFVCIDQRITEFLTDLFFPKCGCSGTGRPKNMNCIFHTAPLCQIQVYKTDSITGFRKIPPQQQA